MSDSTETATHNGGSSPNGLVPEAIRQQFPQTAECVYLNTGTVGLCPLPVVDALLEQIRAFEVGGQIGWGPADAEMNAARERLARRLGVRPEELVFTRNATDGTNLVMTGIEWREGDEVLLSSEEHPSMELPWHYLQQQGKVRLRRFPVSIDPAQTLAAVEAAMSPRTRLVATSHVFCHSGNRAPAAELAALCRSSGALLHLDGAQAVGQFSLDLGAIGADFYAGNCHKWLLGPKGTGFLYLKPGGDASLRPCHVGAGSAAAFSPSEGLTLLESGQRFEYGTRDFARFAALGSLLDWWDDVGMASAERHMQQLSGHLKGRLRELPGVVLHTADGWENASGMTTFSVPGRTCSEIVSTLWERYRVMTRPVEEWEAVRISSALYNTRSEVDCLIAALTELGC
jgi:selenocysteine lyase/cysteine desulfurase